MMVARKKTLFLCISALLAVLVGLLWFFLHIPAPREFPVVHSGGMLIAHAGGAIDGHTYTNSREAVASSIARGFAFIELDLALTTDDVIVAVHDWEEFGRMTGASPGPVSLEDFSSRRILDTYTPLTAKDITDIFNANPHLYLVTDKLTKFKKMTSQLRIPRERMLVEVFSYRQYQKALKAGIFYPMLCVWNTEGLEKNMEYITHGKVRMLTAPYSLVNEVPDIFEELMRNGTKIFIFTVNDEDFVREKANIQFSGCYTDHLIP